MDHAINPEIFKTWEYFEDIQKKSFSTIHCILHRRQNICSHFGRWQEKIKHFVKILSLKRKYSIISQLFKIQWKINVSPTLSQALAQEAEVQKCLTSDFPRRAALCWGSCTTPHSINSTFLWNFIFAKIPTFIFMNKMYLSFPWNPFRKITVCYKQDGNGYDMFSSMLRKKIQPTSTFTKETATTIKW